MGCLVALAKLPNRPDGSKIYFDATANSVHINHGGEGVAERASQAAIRTIRGYSADDLDLLVEPLFYACRLFLDVGGAEEAAEGEGGDSKAAAGASSANVRVIFERALAGLEKLRATYAVGDSRRSLVRCLRTTHQAMLEDALRGSAPDRHRYAIASSDRSPIVEGIRSYWARNHEAVATIARGFSVVESYQKGEGPSAEEARAQEAVITAATNAEAGELTRLYHNLYRGVGDERAESLAGEKPSPAAVEPATESRTGKKRK
jgi:hypothetical protein